MAVDDRALLREEDLISTSEDGRGRRILLVKGLSSGVLVEDLDTRSRYAYLG